MQFPVVEMESLEMEPNGVLMTHQCRFPYPSGSGLHVGHPGKPGAMANIILEDQR